MASRFLHRLSRTCISSLLLHPSTFKNPNTFLIPPLHTVQNFNFDRFVWRDFSTHGYVNLVIKQGKPKFETHEIEAPKKEKWQTKKRLKVQRKKEKEKRKSANRRDPRHIGVKGGKKKKQKFPNAEGRIRYKIEKAKIKEALLIERLKRYEVPKLQGPVIEQEKLTGEERFYMKKMAQKRSNYVLVGRRGVFGGVILNMHLHWKKHETVKIICKPCKPGQVHDYAQEIARLSGGTPIQVIGNDTIIFYRGKDYVQPKIMSPIDTLSKKRALEKSKYEQSLESVRRFIAIAEKELELYFRHVALYGDPTDRSSSSLNCTIAMKGYKPGESKQDVGCLNSAGDDDGDDDDSTELSEMEFDCTDEESESDSDDDENDLLASETDDSEHEEDNVSFQERSRVRRIRGFDNRNLDRRKIK